MTREDVLPPARRPLCPRDFCSREAIREGLPCAYHRDQEQEDPSAAQVDTLTRWGWVPVGGPWWRDPQTQERRHWRAALKRIAGDAARGDLP